MNFGNPSNKISAAKFPQAAPEPQYMDGHILLEKARVEQAATAAHQRAHHQHQAPRRRPDRPARDPAAHRVQDPAQPRGRWWRYQDRRQRVQTDHAPGLRRGQLFFPPDARSNGVGAVSSCRAIVYDLMKAGRGYNVGVLLATQQPEAINKEDHRERGWRGAQRRAHARRQRAGRRAPLALHRQPVARRDEAQARQPRPARVRDTVSRERSRER